MAVCISCTNLGFAFQFYPLFSIFLILSFSNTFAAMNALHCADVPLPHYILAHSFTQQ